MAEHGMSSGSQRIPVQLSSTIHTYPPPEATYEDVMASRELFMETLQKLHSSMGTKFMIPIVGGKGLDLYLLFVEVTSRGGIAKVVKERKWKEVTSVFNFPSSATNASFILRKYYISLLYHYEQMYFFKAKCWTPSPVDALQNASTAPQPNPTTAPPPPAHKEDGDTRTHAHEVTAPEIPANGTPVSGVIDGKFESGYLITVKIGSEELKGVLYNIVPSNRDFNRITTNHNHHHRHTPYAAGDPGSSSTTRRKRRRKSEIRRRDPSRPKPNRSGYNFFFAEQHPLLKPHYHGRDRDISRTIGETWNKLQEHERAVYQEKALRDKERYLAEMTAYKERLRTGHQHHQQQQPIITTDLNLSEDINDVNLQFEGGAEMGSDKSEKSSLEGSESDEEDNGLNSDYENSEEADMGLKNVNVREEDESPELLRQARVGDEMVEKRAKNVEDDSVVQGSSSVPIEEKDRTVADDGGDDLISALSKIDDNSSL